MLAGYWTIDLEIGCKNVLETGRRCQGDLVIGICKYYEGLINIEVRQIFFRTESFIKGVTLTTRQFF